jgi:hypothetical protein
MQQVGRACVGKAGYLWAASDINRSSDWRDIFDKFLCGLAISAGYKAVGYKETYRWGDELCERLIREHLPIVDFFVIVLRNPLLVQSSQYALGWEEGACPMIFNRIYKHLGQLAHYDKAVVVTLEDFVDDPLEYLNAKLPFEIEGDFELLPTGHEFGDPAANRSTGVEDRDREICLPDEWVDMHRESLEVWEQWRST